MNEKQPLDRQFLIQQARRVIAAGPPVRGANAFHEYREGRSVELIEVQLEAGETFDEEAAAAAKVWVREHRAQVQLDRDETRLDLERRGIEAAEQSAKAAHASAMWAKWSLLVATVALVASVWPYVEKLLKRIG